MSLTPEQLPPCLQDIKDASDFSGTIPHPEDIRDCRRGCPFYQAAGMVDSNLTQKQVWMLRGLPFDECIRNTSRNR